MMNRKQRRAIPEPGVPFPSLSSISLSSDPAVGGADTRVCSAETLLGAFSTSATNSRLSQPFHGDGISPAQLTANRANAQHSTGPKTESGRAISSQNRTTHGLARHNGTFQLLPTEDPNGFEALKTSLAEEHEPSTETESILVATMAESHWLANRAQTLQSTCFDQTTGQITNEKLFSLYLRYQTTHTRAFHKSLNDLLKLRSERRKEQNGFEAQTRENESQFKKKDKDRVFSQPQRRILWNLNKKHVCSWCGGVLAWPNFDVDHVHPHSKGGKTDTLNAALLHPKCNKTKSAASSKKK